MLRIGMLGPLTVAIDGVEVDVQSATQRRALLFLALHGNQVVSSERLAEAVWSRRPPADARHAVHSLVHRLRLQLGAGQPVSGTPLVRHDPGYLLAVESRQIDAHDFEVLIVAGRSALAHAPGQALSHLDAALRLWRGDPLMDAAYESWAVAEIRRLEELRVGACESLARLRLDLGQGELAIADLEALTERYPLRESLWVLLWEALARAGRHLEVTASYRRATDLLASAYGITPSEHLHERGARFADPVLTQASPAGARHRPTR